MTFIFVIGCKTDSHHVETNLPGKPIWTGPGPDFFTGDVSPDGRYFAFQAGVDLGTLYIIDSF